MRLFSCFRTISNQQQCVGEFKGVTSRSLYDRELVRVILTIALFILYPITTIFSTMFSEGDSFAILEQSYLLRIIWNSLSVSATVACYPLYSVYVLHFIPLEWQANVPACSVSFFGSANSYAAFCGELGIALMLGRSGYITDFLVNISD
ncbi:iron(III) transport system permease [Actinobacillus pleuropneumoniae]|nr:iron(III) transport system permease [Actinobacillus pleuropneumoniae]